ncbi:MAG TPA: hypothetical protein VLV50_12610 [Stellaceae bacterium]|nr:hypothetical protein [Stellaceae bacterium]
MVQNSPIEQDGAQSPARADLPADVAAVPAAPDKAQKAVSGRRKLLTRGLAGGSIVLFASTHRALAGGSCDLHTYSGYQSLTNAAKKGKKVGKIASGGGKAYCGGLTPGYYKTHTTWPSPYVASGSHATKFNAVFSPSPFSSSTTMLTVLGMGGGGTTAAAREFIAALLNAAGGGGVTDYPYTTTQIKTIWTENYSNLSAYLTYFNTYLDTA